MDAILALVRAFASRHALPAPGERVLCALSGGSDSTALLVAIARLAPELGLEVTAAHVDHGLRGAASASDARDARRLADSLGVRCRVRRAPGEPAPGESPEAWARDVRRAALLDVARETDAARILLGHTADDQAETVLFRALTGTSMTGLAAMRPVSPDRRWLRPLLAARRADLRAALREAGIPWVEDETNRDGRRPRGRIRHEILPLVESRLGPGASDALGRLALEAGDADEVLTALSERLLEEMRVIRRPDGAVELETAPLAAYHPAVGRYALRQAIERVRGSTRDLRREHLVALADLLERSGELHLPGNVRARSAHGRLVLTRGPLEPAVHWLERRIGAGVFQLPVGGWTLTVEEHRRDGLGERPRDDSRQIWLDAERIQGALRVRPRRPGDRFRPFGGPGTRKIKDFLIDSGIPRAERGSVPILCDEAGILWVVGMRRSDRALVGPGTSRVLTIELNKRDP